MDKEIPKIARFWKNQYFEKSKEAEQNKQLILFWVFIALLEAIMLLFILYFYIL